ncbi:MAG: hypothetical protein WB780_01690 [Candidatus Acidiferrales bacterium]
MAPKEFPTADADAFSNFVQGRALFQEYLGNGSGEELSQARDHFATATARDPKFDIAKLYLAVTQTELRDTATAIPALEQLILNKSFLPEAHVQLAYAHIKLYTDDDFAKADKELDEAAAAAKTEHRNDLIDLICAYRVFLFAVRGGRGHESPDQKRKYLESAKTLGNRLLKRPVAAGDPSAESMAVQFEANNGMGIASLWFGELFPTDPQAAQSWVESEGYLKAALALRPKSVRVLQNMGLLYMVQGDRAEKNPAKAQELYGQAKDFVGQSLKLNPFDQYPHFQMALLSIKTGDWTTAQTYVDSGTKQKGAVGSGKWSTLKEAIHDRDASKVRGLR